MDMIVGKATELGVAQIFPLMMPGLSGFRPTSSLPESPAGKELPGQL